MTVETQTFIGFRDILLLGIIARKEIKNGTYMGRELKRLRAKRLAENKTRRQGK
jgi:hypothetical protein